MKIARLFLSFILLSSVSASAIADGVVGVDFGNSTETESKTSKWTTREKDDNPSTETNTTTTEKDSFSVGKGYSVTDENGVNVSGQLDVEVFNERETNANEAGLETDKKESRGVDLGASKKIGKSKSVEASGENANGSYGTRADASLEGGFKWKVGTGGLNVEANAKAGGEASANGEVHGQIGDDINNVHASANGEVTAELIAEALAKANIDKEGFELTASGEVGASVSASAEATLGFTLFGITLDGVAGARVSAGAELSGEASVKFDRDAGKIDVELGAGAAILVGGGAYTKLSIGLGDSLGRILDILFPTESQDSADPFDSEPMNGGGSGSGTGGSGGGGSSTGDGSSSSNGGYNGIKAIKIFHY